MQNKRMNEMKSDDIKSILTDLQQLLKVRGTTVHLCIGGWGGGGSGDGENIKKTKCIHI